MLEIGRPAGQTGTTTDWRDNWTLGYTPDLTVGVWVATRKHADEGRERHQRRRADLARFHGHGDAHRPQLDFTRPDGLVRVEVCADSGLLPLRSRGEEEWGSRGERLLLSS